MLRALFFDLDETLLDDSSSLRAAVRFTAQSLAAEMPDIDAGAVEEVYLGVSDAIWTELTPETVAAIRAEGAGAAMPAGASLPLGSDIRRYVWRQVLARFGHERLGLAEAAADLYSAQRRRTYRLFPEVAGVLEGLRGRVKLGVITNGPGDTQREKARVTGLDRYLDLLVPSGDLGAGKPSPEIFRHALARADVAASAAVHVGDSLVNDVGGARDAGLTAVWINRSRGSRPPEAP